MCKRATIIHGVCRAILSGVAIVVLHVSAAEVPNAAPNAVPKKAVPKAAARASQDSVQIQFSPNIVVTPCNGNVPLQWSSQGIMADHTTGNFDFNLSPNEPNVLNLKGNVNATTFHADLKCATGTGGPTGTIDATGSGNTYTGTFVLGSSVGNVTITLTPGGGGGGGGAQVTGSVSPNPGVAGQPVFFKGTITPEAGHKVDSLDQATISWGDGTVTGPISAPTILPMFKAGTLTHTYATEGVYDLNLYLDRVGDAPGSGESIDFFVVIGAGSVSVNSATGATITAQVNGSAVQLAINATPVAGADSASTTFEDSGGGSLTANALTGFSVGQSIPSAGLVVGTSQILDAANAPLLVAKKTLGISEFSLGTPGALTPPASTGFKKTSIKGKFLFNVSQPDVVVFSGQFTLAPGFTPGRSDANTMQFSIGNLIDTVTLDSKGNAKTGARSRIKKLSVKIPKLKTGVALGTEIVKVSMEYNATDLPGKGFASEGIISKRGTNEDSLKVLTRFVQLNMFYAGVAYESLIAVNYTLSKNSDFGTIQGRK